MNIINNEKKLKKKSYFTSLFQSKIILNNIHIPGLKSTMAFKYTYSV